MIHVIAYCQDTCENYEKPRLVLTTKDAQRAVEEASIIHDQDHYAHVAYRRGEHSVTEIDLEGLAAYLGVMPEQVRAMWQTLNIIPKDE